MERKRIRKKGVMLNALFLLSLFCGCTQSEVVTGGKEEKAVEVSSCFHLNILATTVTNTRSVAFDSCGTVDPDSIPEVTGETVTRSTSDPGDISDKTILNLWVGQYGTNGDLVTEEYFSSMASQESVNLPLKRIEGTSHVWAVANAGNLTGKAATESDLKAYSVENAFTDDGLPNNNLCVMTGMWSGEIKENISADIQLKRSLAKIKFTYSVGGENFSFIPSSLELCNAPVWMKYIGEENPTQLTGDESFKTYTAISPGNSGTQYWYLPENPAGTGSNTGNEAVNKTGAGVTHATCIRLTGDAVQDGVRYENVVFTLYPGNGNNDYTIVRNGLYTINVTLTGIDFSDKRVTVGTVPEMQDPDNLGAEKGATGIFQVTTRPGMPWSFTIPTWLSAVVGETTYEAGNKLDFIGPYKVEFKTVTANPRAEERETSFTVGEKEITVRQNPSVLATGTSVLLDAGGGSEGNGSFTATRGIPWSATLTSEWGEWLGWNGDAPQTGAEASGTEESLEVKTLSSNPSAASRTGTILVKAGDAISTTYPELTKSISVTQAGATISVTDPTPKPGPEAAEKLSDSFIATHDLPWVAIVTSGTDWLSLLTPENGTTGTGSQTIDYKTTLNLNASERRGTIKVQVGNETGDSHPGPSEVITVIQAGSVFDVSPTELDLESTASTGTVTVTGTKGLPWTVTPSDTKDGITPGTTSGTMNASSQTLKFSSTANTGMAREAIFTIAVSGGNHSKTVKVKQKSGLTGPSVTIDQSVLQSYYTQMNANSQSWKTHPPFDADGINSAESHGITDVNLSSTPTMTGSYAIQVEKGQKAKDCDYSAIQEYCSGLKEDGLSGWRVPTMIELHAIYINKKTIESYTGFSKFLDRWYWSSSLCNGSSSERCKLKLNTGEFNVPKTSDLRYGRCVRDL
ncbi:BACON domain-containing protein [Parabacteroides faecis]|uniref:BACON domain-containing protein n=2 Tax=Parabacteroides faecis TaxID=1217282 RepID=UPI00216609DB|nr:BACON domain-containing carbohydrate-binding protein [Parabacteroides faecis]MCS2893870.1 DUF1566 domain-containing protein [Parabacteroides faecis]